MTAFIKAILAKLGILLHGLSAQTVVNEFEQAMAKIVEAHSHAVATKTNAVTTINVLSGEIAAAQAIIDKAQAITGK